VSGQRTTDRYDMETYWSRVHELDERRGVDEMSLVMHHDLPRYYNRFYDHVERRAYFRAWHRAGIPARGACVEIGAGRGRWTRRLLERGLNVHGIDISERSVRRLRELFPRAAFHAGSASEIALPTGTVDLVSSVVVLLHLPPLEKDSAIREIGRILKPGGFAILIESIYVKDRASHVFPLSAESWIDRFRDVGMDCVYHRGQEFVPLLRCAEELNHLALCWRTPEVRGAGRRFVAFVLRALRYAANKSPSRKLTVALSYVIEPLAERVLPLALARHGVFVFRRSED